MKTLIPILITLLAAMLFSCSNEPNEEFSFTYNGKKYHNTSANLNIGVILPGIQRIFIHMPDVFGGEIYFDIQNCAYLVPEFPGSYIGQNCTLYSTDQYTPIDSSKVFAYQSGSLNLTIGECNTYTVEDPFGFFSYEVTTCQVSGTFDLTLVNKNNETIEITNGLINNFPVDN